MIKLILIKFNYFTVVVPSGDYCVYRGAVARQVYLQMPELTDFM